VVNKKKSNRLKRFVIIIALILAGILAGTAAFAIYYNPGKESSLPGSEEEFTNRVSFLLIGADKRPGDTSFNADSIIVATFNPQSKIISLLSIPRDTRVTLPGYKGYYKINAIPMLKGIPELEKLVTDLTGIKLDGYVLTNFAGFKDIVDALGGITIDVEKRMKFETGDKEDGYIDLQPGVQTLDGSKALQYARFRHDATADIGRTERQQKVLKAMAKKMMEPATILKLPKLVPQLIKYVETDLSLKDLLILAGAAKSFSDATLVSQTLPGDAIMLDGLSYWEVNRTKAKEVAQKLLLGQTTDEVWDSSVLASLDPEVKAHLDSNKKEIVIDMSEIPGIAVPIEGAVPVKTIQTEQYSGTVTWSPDDNIFLAEQKYTATITLVPKSGYTLKGVAKDFFIVPGAITHNAADSGVITASFPETLPTDPTIPSDPTDPTNPTEPTDPTNPTEPTDPPAHISLKVITGITPPAAGAIPVTSVNETEQYTGTVVWSPADDVFGQGRQYTATISLIPKEGYTLEGIGENYFIVPGATATNAAGSGVVTAVFPAIE